MAARKSDADTATGGWLRRRGSQRRKNPQLGAGTNTLGLQKRSPLNAPSAIDREPTTSSKNANVPSTSMPELNKKQLRVQATSKTNLKANPKNNLTPKRSELRLKVNTPIPVMSSATEAMPIWLLRLHSLQRYTSAITFLLVVATLVAYGWTVYSQQIWSQAYRKLLTLQRHERQVTITNNVLKSNMAADAENPNAGLVSPSPAGTIFVPASASTNSVSEETLTMPVQQQNTAPAPGY